jgi:hypothetical protein
LPGVAGTAHDEVRHDEVVPADALDQLYRATPEQFMALRTRLAAEAKQRGDAAEAKRIAAARKPTTAAWVVNQLADDDTRARLSDLGGRLRDAHAAVDPQRIRELSVEQRRLVDELARTAFERADLRDPAAALRDDVTGTLQAAIADPDVTAQLGRLAKAERWSGFGGFGGATPVLTVVPGGRSAPRAGARAGSKAKGEAKPDGNGEADTRAKGGRRSTSSPPAAAPRAAARETVAAQKAAAVREAETELATASATVTAAEQAKAAADDEVTDRQAELAAARMRHREAQKRLHEAEQRLAEAEAAFADAKAAGREAAELLTAARQRQKLSRSALAKARR